MVGESKQSLHKATKSKNIVADSPGRPMFSEDVVTHTHFTEEGKSIDICQVFAKKPVMLKKLVMLYVNIHFHRWTNPASFIHNSSL